MTVPIDAGAGLIFIASCVVGYAVHRHTRKTSTTLPPTGDIGAAFTAGATALAALAFLFGASAPAVDAGPGGPQPSTAVTPAVPDAPSPPYTSEASP